jgi:hypothetical protein
LADGLDRLVIGSGVEFDTGISARNGKLRATKVKLVD